MTDQTTADDEHVCKPGANVYFCPTSGETESGCHGGFDACCDRPDLHQPTDEACQQLAEKLDTVRPTAEAWARPSMSAPSRAAGEHLLRVLSAEAADQTTPLRDRIARWEQAAWAAGRTVDRNALAVYMVVADQEQAAVLRAAADRLSMDWGGPDHEEGMEEARKQLRRMADETATTEIGRGCPSDCPCRAVCIGTLKPAAGARQDEPDADACTCGDAGECFRPAGHYADCPAAGARQDGADRG